MWYDRLMVVTGTRVRLWPFVILAFVGAILLGVSVAAGAWDQPPLQAVELLK
jgi:hypothetical protein